jgi:hypothetical protein
LSIEFNDDLAFSYYLDFTLTFLVAACGPILLPCLLSALARLLFLVSHYSSTSSFSNPPTLTVLKVPKVVAEEKDC